MAKYKITGKRFLRKYSAPSRTPTYSAHLDAEKIAANLGSVEWEETAEREATFPAHSGKSEASDAENVETRNIYDAALFCGEHTDGKHRAFANAACYRFTIPDSVANVRLTELSVRVNSDPYNSTGARISVYVSDESTPPLDCATCRTGSSSDVSSSAQTNNGADGGPATEWYSTNTHVEAVSPRREDGGNWFATSGQAIIRPEGGLLLKKYLYVFVLLENYAVARNGFLEGSSYAEAEVELSADSEILGWSLSGVNDTTKTAGLVLGKYEVQVVSKDELDTGTKGKTRELAFRPSTFTPIASVGGKGISLFKEGNIVFGDSERNFIVAIGDFLGESSFNDIPGVIIYDTVLNKKINFGTLKDKADFSLVKDSSVVDVSLWPCDGDNQTSTSRVMGVTLHYGSYVAKHCPPLFLFRYNPETGDCSYSAIGGSAWAIDDTQLGKDWYLKLVHNNPTIPAGAMDVSRVLAAPVASIGLPYGGGIMVFSGGPDVVINSVEELVSGDVFVNVVVARYVHHSMYLGLQDTHSVLRLHGRQVGAVCLIDDGVRDGEDMERSLVLIGDFDKINDTVVKHFAKITFSYGKSGVPGAAQGDSFKHKPMKDSLNIEPFFPFDVELDNYEDVQFCFGDFEYDQRIDTTEYPLTESRRVCAIYGKFTRINGRKCNGAAFITYDTIKEESEGATVERFTALQIYPMKSSHHTVLKLIGNPNFSCTTMSADVSCYCLR